MMEINNKKDVFWHIFLDKFFRQKQYQKNVRNIT